MLTSKKQAKSSEKRLRMMFRRLVNLKKAHQKELETNKKLINKVVKQELAFSQAKKTNFDLKKEMLDLTFTLSLKISQYNELKQLYENVLTVLNKTLTSFGNISMNLLNSYQHFAEHLKKFDNISSKENLRSQSNMVTKPESQMTISSLATDKPFMSNPQELHARKKTSLVVKLHPRKQATLSPIAEIKSPKVSRRTQGGQFYHKNYFLRSSNQFQTTIQYSTSDNNNCENIGKSLVSWNKDLSESEYNNNSGNLSIYSMPQKKRTGSSQNLKSKLKNLNETKSFTIKPSFTNEPSPERNIATVSSLKLEKEEASSIFEESTETKNKRTRKKKSQVYSQKKCRSSTRKS